MNISLPNISNKARPVSPDLGCTSDQRQTPTDTARPVSPDLGCTSEQRLTPTDSPTGSPKRKRVVFVSPGKTAFSSDNRTAIHATCYIPKDFSESLGAPVREFSNQSEHTEVPCSKRARYGRDDRLSHQSSYSGGLWQKLFYPFKQYLPKLLTSIDSPKLENINLSDFQTSIQTEEIYSKKPPQDFIIQIINHPNQINSTNISSSIRRYLKGQLITQFPFFFYTKPCSDRTDDYIINRFQPFFKNTTLLLEIIFNSKHPSDELCQSLSELLDTDPSLSNLHPDVKISLITMITDPSSQLNTAIRSCFKNYLEDLNLTVAKIITHIQSQNFQDTTTFETNLLLFLQNQIQQ